MIDGDALISHPLKYQVSFWKRFSTLLYRSYYVAIFRDFCLFVEIILVVSMIRTRIVGVEGEYADH